MKNPGLATKTYRQFLTEIKEEIKKRQYRALQTVNRELISLYWEIGKKIVEKQGKSGWGEGIVEKLAQDLATAFPDTKGFSERNLWNMKKYYLAYKDFPKLQTLSAEICWSNNLLIIEQIKDKLEREFYLKSCIRERWSHREMTRQIDTDLFTRYMGTEKRALTLPAKSEDKLAPFKDHYVLDFLGLGPTHSEEELRKAILTKLRDFFLEFGKNFSFVGEEYPLRVGGDTFEIDLLFYHRELRCLVPVELKIGMFKPEYIGKMQFYLSALDEQIKQEHENPSVGLILCKSKNDETVRIAVSQASRKIGVATYQTKLLDTKLLEKKLHQMHLPENIEEEKKL
jgi:predicted nuclease of restriction endonuclease-like (RecB) superfamily